MTLLKHVQPALAFALSHLDEDVRLAKLAEQAGLSAFHLHRTFARVAGETPKQFTLRLRLSWAASTLLTSGDSVLKVALDSGFRSHETFCRAFRKRFGTTPSAYRARGFHGELSARETERHTDVVQSAGPCIALFRIQRRLQDDMKYSIAKKEIPAQPVLVVRRRIKPSEVASTLAEVLGHVFLYAQRNGIALAGQPFTRYIEWGPGMWTIEAGLPVVEHADDSPATSEVRADTLPGGLAATTTHSGPYDNLGEAHAAVQQWIEAEGLAPAGAPWEVYTTDPAHYPDPKDWKTEVVWPVK